MYTYISNQPLVTLPSSIADRRLRDRTFFIDALVTVPSSIADRPYFFYLTNP